MTPKLQEEMFDDSQLDLSLFTHVTEIPFSAIYDEEIEASVDEI